MDNFLLGCVIGAIIINFLWFKHEQEKRDKYGKY